MQGSALHRSAYMLTMTPSKYWRRLDLHVHSDASMAAVPDRGHACLLAASAVALAQETSLPSSCTAVPLLLHCCRALWCWTPTQLLWWGADGMAPLDQ